MKKQLDKHFSNLLKTKKNQNGQALIVTLAFAAITAIVVVLMFNSAQASNHKTKLVNAADASAYSAGVWTARQLNFMAYTNRAMMTNHVMVGHFVSYASWAEHAADTTKNISRITDFIPYVGSAVRAVSTVADTLHNVNDNVGPVFVPAVDAMNGALSSAQGEAHKALTGLPGVQITPVHQVMEATAKTYSPNIEINSLSNVNNAVKASYQAKVASEQSTIRGFVKEYNTQTNDQGVQRMDYLVQQTEPKSQKWLNGRKWKKGVIGGRLKKVASNTRGLQDWQSSDQLKFKAWGSKKYKSIGRGGRASVSDFDSNYQGINKFYDLSDLNPTAQKSLYVSAYASMPMSDVRLNSTMDMTTNVPEIAAASTAEVFHQRSSYFASLGNNRTEYSNISNPFWQVRLQAKGSSSEGGHLNTGISHPPASPPPGTTYPPPSSLPPGTTYPPSSLPPGTTYPPLINPRDTVDTPGTYIP